MIVTSINSSTPKPLLRERTHEMTQLTKKIKAELTGNAFRFLRKHVRPGTTVYTNVLHTSKSGMTRDISLYVVIDGNIVTISGFVARVLGNQFRNNGGVRVGGCGMDMGFHLVHSLSYALHGTKDVNVPDDCKGRPFTATETAHKSGYSLEHQRL